MRDDLERDLRAEELRESLPVVYKRTERYPK